jgi:hypothetical protein
MSPSGNSKRSDDSSWIVPEPMLERAVWGADAAPVRAIPAPVAKRLREAMREGIGRYGEITHPALLGGSAAAATMGTGSGAGRKKG